MAVNPEMAEYFPGAQLAQSSIESRDDAVMPFVTFPAGHAAQGACELLNEPEGHLVHVKEK